MISSIGDCFHVNHYVITSKKIQIEWRIKTNVLKTDIVEKFPRFCPTNHLELNLCMTRIHQINAETELCTTKVNRRRNECINELRN